MFQPIYRWLWRRRMRKPSRTLLMGGQEARATMPLWRHRPLTRAVFTRADRWGYLWRWTRRMALAIGLVFLLWFAYESLGAIGFFQR
ncbi:MAG: hypothetical protein ACFBZ8_08710 [Opitutales bacterium]